MSLKATPRIHCPIEPEVLLADIQGELPIDEARLVQMHIRTCERCQARATQLRAAYEQIASLADVPHVPIADVRDAVLRDSHPRLRAMRIAGNLNLSGRTLALAITGLAAALILLIVFIAQPFLRSHFLSTQRSQNSLTHVAAIGPGIFYAETVKLIPVTVGKTQWDLGEIIAVDEHTGRVVQSLPASSNAPFLPELGIGSGTNIRPALSADGRTIVEAAIAADGRNPTAFAVIDSLTGTVRYVQPLAVPATADAQSDPIIHQMWISPDSATIYVLTDLAVNGQRAPHVLQFALLNGAQSTNIWPPLDDTHASTALAASSTTIIPSQTMLYSATMGTNAQGQAGLNIAFVSITHRQVAATLFLPGDYRFFGLAASPDGSQVFIFNGHTGLLTFLSTASRSIIGQLTVSIPGAPPKTGSAQLNNEAVTLAVTPDGKRLILTRDAPNDAPRNFELWSIDIGQQALLYTNLQTQPFGPMTLTSDGSTVIMLRDNGKLETLPTIPSQTQSSTPNAWVTLADGAQIIQEIGSDVPPTAGH